MNGFLMLLLIRSHVIHDVLIGSTTLLFIAVNVDFLSRRLITRDIFALIIRNDSFSPLTLCAVNVVFLYRILNKIDML